MLSTMLARRQPSFDLADLLKEEGLYRTGIPLSGGSRNWQTHVTQADKAQGHRFF